MTFDVTRSNGDRATYTVLPVTVVAFERNFKVGIGAMATDTKMEWVYWLAWHAEKTTGAVVKPFDDWLVDIASVDPVDDDTGPLVPAPTPPA